MLLDQTIAAYIAGMIDGDGYITVTRSVRRGKEYFGAQVGIAGTRREPHDLAASIWGGSVSCYVPKNPNYRPQFQWQRMGKAAVPVIEAIHPYLRIKGPQAEAALQAQFLAQMAASDDPFPWFGPNYDALPELRGLRSEAIDLNQSRNRVGKKLAGRKLDGITHDGFPVPA